MIDLNGHIQNIEGEKVLEHLEKEIREFPEKKIRYAEFGINLHSTYGLEKSAFLYLKRLSKIRELSPKVTFWMDDFLKNKADEHITRNFVR